MAKHSIKTSVEILEQRIAPAGLLNEAGFRTAQIGTPLLLTAGQGLSTGGVGAGTYLLYVEKGSALVFTTDLNNNNSIDYNEITGIAAGNGLRLISFVDIHGDIVTNLRPDSRLSDSDNNSSNDNQDLGGDGRVLLNSVIEKIEFRSLTTADIGDQDGIGARDAQGRLIADEVDVQARLALSSYSIFGNILAGGGFGLSGDATSGLIIDNSGIALQQQAFPGLQFTTDKYIAGFTSSIGSIKVGTAASDTPFSFSVTRGDDIQGRIVPFTPAPGSVGAGIYHVRAASDTATFNLNSLEAGNGGVGGRGGNVEDIQLNGDNAGGYQIIAGNGGSGTTGGGGGSIVGLSDFGSITGDVILKTGSGGTGTTKTGGNGGTLSFGTMNLNGNVQVLLGNGGNGFTGGGNGAGIGAGTVTTPLSTDYYPLEIVSTTVDRDGVSAAAQIANNTVNPLENISSSIPIDFNEDGIGDFLYTTADPNLMFVVLGGGGQVRISLPSPILANAVTVGDFNGDGHQDIAAGSSADGSFGGIYVFLSRFEDRDGNGLSSTEDLNGDGTNSLLGFDTPLHSTLPALFNGDSIAAGGGANLGYKRSATPIGSIAAGDFNGDGNTDLAVFATYLFYDQGRNEDVPYQVLIFMTADTEDGGRATGQFYADFGERSVTAFSPAVDNFGSLLMPAFFQSGTGTAKVHVTRTTTTSDHAVAFVGQEGGKTVYSLDAQTPAITGPTRTAWDLGKVDTNRLPQQGDNRNVSLEDATLKDFTLADLNGDGVSDVAAITIGPSPDFLVLIAGDGTGGPAPAATRYLSNAPGEPEQNAGISFKDGDGATFKAGTPLVSIKTTLNQELAILNYGPIPQPAPAIAIDALTYEPKTDVNSLGGTLARTPGTAFNINVDNSIVAYDVYYPDVNDTTTASYITGEPYKADISNGAEPPFINIDGLPVVADLVRSSFSITAGNGGNALAGRGGNGGSIGGSLGTALDPTTGLPTGALNLTFTISGNISSYTAGDGGNGFTTGGSGGNVSGFVVRTLAESGGSALGFSEVYIFAGDGGYGVSGAGGAGGSISQNSIQDGYILIAGDGGRGKVGGAGGSVVGNGRANLFDTQGGGVLRDPVTDMIIRQGFTVQAGVGGDGVRGGGAGGDVLNFKPSINIGNASYYVYAGEGGNGSAGVGGRGGNITNASPLTSGINFLDTEIYLEAGAGGNGSTGGAGGSISRFIDNPTSNDNPSLLTFLAGQGGRGTTGNGGAGGSLSGLSVPSKGTADAAFPVVSLYGFNRLLAGNGGDSAAGVGGAGGAVTNITDVTAVGGSMAIVAGEGGSGLRGGGKGGSVTSTIAGVGAATSKLLVIAGKGGDSTARAFNANDPDPELAQKTFGGTIGRAGDGGSVVGLTQTLGISSRVDVIAGNGGDTLRYGTVTDRTNFVGRGGSVSTLRITGNIGNLDPAVPLKSYNVSTDNNNDGLPDQSVADFVEANLRSAAGSGTILDDNLGNVGIIVGAAGRLKTIQTNPGSATPVFDTLPAGGGVNGSLTSITARGLASAVAGSIERLAAIQSVSGLRIGFQIPGGPFIPGTVGADKGAQNVLEYYDADGNIVTSPVFDGALLDGAVLARSYVGARPAGRVFTI